MGLTKKVLYTGGILLATTVLAAGCSNKEKKADNADFSIEGRYELDATQPAWKLDKKEEPTKLTWYVNADWWNTDFGNDVVTKKIKEDLNVEITFITGDDTKLNTFFAGDDMPDLITIFDANKSKVGSQANTWAMPLNDLAEKYDPYFNEVAAEDTFNWYQLSDGKTYGYPNYSNTAADYDNGSIPANTNFLIRQDVYEAIGKPAMGTPAEFEKAMNDIKAKFPELIPFGFNSFGESTGSLGDVLQDFIGVPLETEKGEFYNRNLDEDYLTWVKSLNTIYRDGNLSDDSFADDGVAFEEKVKSGKYATIMANGTAQMSGYLQTWVSSNKDAAYIGIDGPQSTVGNEPTLNQSGISGWMASYITQSNPDPAKSMQIFTYLLDEPGGILTTFGVEGETFQYDEDGLIEFLPEVIEMKENDSDRYKKELRLSEFLFFGHDKYQSLASKSTQTPALVQPREWGAGKLYPHFVLENINPEQGSAEARALSGIDTNWATTLVSLIRADSDKEFDKLVEDHKAFLADNKMEDISKIRTEKMEDNREKLGLK